MTKKFAKGFTLVELLIVIAIIAILAAVVVLIVNPLELTRRSRDSARLTDLANIQQAINIALQEGSASAQASPACNDAAVTNQQCGPYRTSDTSGPGASRATNGTGWVAINFAGQSNVTVPVLPLDPSNPNIAGNGTIGRHYTYCGLGTNWRIMANLESQREVSEAQREANDGGLDSTVYEVGSDLTTAWAFCSY